MSLLSRSASIVAKSSLSLISLIGLAAMIAAPASAENASVSGAMTRTSPGGFVTSISGEMVAPKGAGFVSPLTVTGSISDSETATLTVNAVLQSEPGYGATSVLEQEVLRALEAQNLATEQGLDAYVAILKAAVGQNGLQGSGFVSTGMD